MTYVRQLKAPLLAACYILSIAGCVQNANGVRFNQISHDQPKQGQANIYFFRDNAFYFVQASYIVKANITVDGREIGGLKNGGFTTTTTIPAGKHTFTVWSGTDRTDWNLNVPAGINIYFQVWDKTRMEGARAAGGFVVGATTGGVAGAIPGVTLRKAHHL